MYDVFVLNANAVPIDLDRAVPLMDRRLWMEVSGRMMAQGETDFQVFWDRYCNRHHDRFGEAFAPQLTEEPL